MGDHQANIGNVTETVFAVEQWNLTWRLILAVGHGTACACGPDDSCKSVIKMLHPRGNYLVTSPSRRAYMNITRILALSYTQYGLLVWPGKKLLESLPEVTNSVCTVHTLILNWTVIITVMRSNSAVITTLLCSSLHAETDNFQS